MKRVFACFVFIALVAGTLAVTASAQSLGDVARQQRAKKPAPSPSAKVYTNDTIGSAASERADSETPTAPATSDSTAPAAEGSESPSSSSADELAKKEAEWKGKFAEQKKVIAQLEREIDVLNRENKLRAATFYSDAGNRLRDEKKYAEDDRKYQADIAAKEQELATAKQTFEDMQEQARKDGMPSRVSED